MLNSKIISIAGSSGVGKSTIAQLLCILLEDAYHLTGDNYHRWPRGDSNWKRYTHLNPIANNLVTLHSHLTSLKSGSTINVKKYNHSSGTFDPEQEVRPHKHIISDGLHSLYSPELCEISDLKIFVDTDEDLKLQWKLDRDVNDRGYSRAQVLSAIKNRQPDEISYINPQKANADVVIRFNKGEDKINCVVEESKCNKENTKIIEDLVALYNNHLKFVEICNDVGTDKNLITGRGGNVSYKSNGKVIITSSGCKLSEVTMFKNVSICSEDRCLFGGKPSMELEVHKLLGDCVVHIHPVYLNALLCSEQGKDLLSEIFSGFNFTYIPYTCPGHKLRDAVDPHSSASVLFLENHGLFCSAPTMMGAYYLARSIAESCKNYYDKRAQPCISEEATKQFLYPDAVVYESEKEENQRLLSFIISLGLKPKYLTKSEVLEIQTSEDEKYRKKLV